LNTFDLLLIAVGLSMDAFAVAICKGISTRKNILKQAIIVGLWFGIFQALMPLMGYFAGSRFEQEVSRYSHWITFALLLCIGGKMIWESFDKGKPNNNKIQTKQTNSAGLIKMFLLALATSIDALAVGVTFAFNAVEIYSTVLLIGIITFVFSAAGVRIGSIFGIKYKSKAEFAGGAVLVFIGSKVLVEHFLV